MYELRTRCGNPRHTDPLTPAQLLTRRHQLPEPSDSPDTTSVVFLSATRISACRKRSALSCRHSLASSTALRMSWSGCSSSLASSRSSRLCGAAGSKRAQVSRLLWHALLSCSRRQAHADQRTAPAHVAVVQQAVGKHRLADRCGMHRCAAGRRHANVSWLLQEAQWCNSQQACKGQSDAATCRLC